MVISCLVDSGKYVLRPVGLYMPPQISLRVCILNAEKFHTSLTIHNTLKARENQNLLCHSRMEEWKKHQCRERPGRRNKFVIPPVFLSSHLSSTRYCPPNLFFFCHKKTWLFSDLSSLITMIFILLFPLCTQSPSRNVDWFTFLTLQFFDPSDK